MKITTIRYYGGAREKVCRLGLADLFLELQQILFETRIELAEEQDANSAAVVREAIDASFQSGTEWVKIAAGGVDWTKRIRYNQTYLARLGLRFKVRRVVTCLFVTWYTFAIASKKAPSTWDVSLFQVSECNGSYRIGHQA